LAQVETDDQRSVESADPGAPPVDGAARGAPGGFPIVGIGASAGGLAAFEAFFSAMPPDTESGMAFVLVQHLAPDHKSILSDLVKRYTRMEVFEVADGMRVRANCTYIIPPNRDMALLNGTLRLLEPAARRGQRLPIAQDQHEQAICVVLSGTGSDGTLGARAVKGEGGLVMVQSPESTEYDGMPRSAIGTGLVDYVLPPGEMPAQLVAYASRTTGHGGRARAAPATQLAEGELQRVFVLLRAQTGHDFSQYKQSTISRRVERRMAVQQIEQLDDYVRYLQGTPSEVEALFQDFLIGVTSFFRDPAAFQALETQVIPRLLADKPTHGALRAWVPGCSTGEEAFSVAMLLQEARDALKLSVDIQVFATDIDSRAVNTARAGVYPASIAADVTSERLASHFSQIDDSHYRIRPHIRDLVVFSEQDVVKDPPFSKLDLISCRNLLIYMDGELQQRLIPLFHYALRPGGALFLGTSETIGEFGNLFATTDRTAKLYRRQEDPYGVPYAHLWKARSWPAERGAGFESPRTGTDAKLPLRELTERALLEDGPVAALVDERGEVLYLHGHTGNYLEPAPGEMGTSIFKMAREGLQHDLTSALHKAVSTRERVVRTGVRVKTNGDVAQVDLAVRPLSQGAPSRGQALFLVVFQASLPQPLPVASSAVEGTSGETARFHALEEELRTKDEYLHATQEEMQVANEELRSSNEELQSTNEELQSTNEELETSKEELQSMNEELTTVNGELQAKVTDLARVNNDMNNLLAGTGIGTLFVDHQLRIQRFTPAVTQFINVIHTDVGRPLAHIVSNLVGYDRLVTDIQAVLDTLAQRELEVRTGTGAWFLLRIRPYRTTKNVIEGAVITFTEVSALKNAQAVLRESETLRRLAGVVRDATDAITVQDLEGSILAWNPGAVRMYGWTEAEALKLNIRTLTPDGLRDEALPLVQRLSTAQVAEPLRTQRLTKDGRIVDVMVTATALMNDRGIVYAVATMERGAAL
jgi:two-component system CheB/CheR fusion protein